MYALITISQCIRIDVNELLYYWTVPSLFPEIPFRNEGQNNTGFQSSPTPAADFCCAPNLIAYSVREFYDVWITFVSLWKTESSVNPTDEEMSAFHPFKCIGKLQSSSIFHVDWEKLCCVTFPGVIWSCLFPSELALRHFHLSHIRKPVSLLCLLIRHVGGTLFFRSLCLQH